MTRSNIILLGLIVIIFGFSLWAIVPLQSSIDLTYQIQASVNATTEEKTSILDQAITTIQERLEAKGFTESKVTKQEEDRILVQFPEYSDEIGAVQAVGQIENLKYVETKVHGERFGRKGMRLGLDLVGGVYLVYEADFTQNATQSQQTLDIDRAVTTIQNRIDKYGVTEPVVQSMGEDRIMVQLPGFTDIDAAKSLVEQTGFLEFRQIELNTQGQPVYLRDYLQQPELQFIKSTETGNRIFVAEFMTEEDLEFDTVGYLVQDETGIGFRDPSGNPTDNTTLQLYGSSLSWIPARGNDGTALTGEYLADAFANVNQQAIPPEYVVDIEWNSEGTVIFDEIAKRLYNSGAEGSRQRQLGIFLDDTLLSAPHILREQYQGSGQITGSFSRPEAEDLANLLKSGALPMPLKQPPLYQEKVSATLGANFIDLSWIAGVVGIALVMLFMMAYYRLPGLVASIALLFYAVLVLMLFKIWPVTLSLAGLGGFVVSIGMAVDANVLIFERLKEELRTGRALRPAIEVGFNRAWKAILDSNITTIIACLILIWLASSVIASAQVMGFAVTLLLGVIVSMFTAMVVTRTLLRLIVHTGLGRRMGLFRIDWGKK
jgi:protein-export membrane protein SecD